MAQKLFLSALFALAAWTPAWPAKEAKTAKLRIGIIAPLTGPLAEFGRAVQNGIKLASNDGSLSRCEFQYEDSGNESRKAISAFTKLTDHGRVNLIYNWGTVTTEALAPIAERRRMPLVAWTADPEMTKGKHFVVRFTNSAADYGKVLARHLHSLGKRKIALVLSETQYLEAMHKGLRAALYPNQSLDIIATFNPSDQDFHSIITRMRSKDYDALGVFLVTGQVAQFYRQLEEQRLKIPTFGTDFFESSTEISNAGPAMDGAFYSNNAVDPSFHKQYLTTFGNDSQVTHAGNAYDFSRMSCESLTDGRYGSEELIEKLKQVRRRGVLGTFAYVRSESADQFFAFPIMIKTIRGQEIQKQEKAGSSYYE